MQKAAAKPRPEDAAANTQAPPKPSKEQQQTAGRPQPAASQEIKALLKVGGKKKPAPAAAAQPRPPMQAPPGGAMPLPPPIPLPGGMALMPGGMMAPMPMPGMGMPPPPFWVPGQPMGGPMPPQAMPPPVPQQKPDLGNRVYAFVQAEHGELAGKLTGMLLEGIPTEDLEKLMSDPPAMQQKVNEALNALKKEFLEEGVDAEPSETPAPEQGAKEKKKPKRKLLTPEEMEAATRKPQ